MLPPLVFEFLKIDHFLVVGAAQDELVVRADVHDPPVVDEDDLVHIFDGGDTVRDEDGREPRPVLFEVREDLLLRLGVDGGDGIVQDEDLIWKRATC